MTGKSGHDLNSDQESNLEHGAAWMKGRVIPIAEASIPVNDWGLVHSDITYDVVPVIDGAFFRLDDYLDRFFASMASLRLDPEMDRASIIQALHHMVGLAGLRDAYVAMVCSRGTPKIAGTRDPRQCQNHFFAWCVPYIHVIKPDILAKGASAWIAQSVFRIPDASVNPLVKNYHWGDFTKGLFEAKDNNYETVILADSEGYITEGPGFNVFAVKDGIIITSDHGALGGISRLTVLEMAQHHNIISEIRPLTIAELLNADEVFISSSGGGVMPITKVNETIFANHACGHITDILRQTYWQWARHEAFRTAIAYLDH